VLRPDAEHALLLRERAGEIRDHARVDPVLWEQIDEKLHADVAWWRGGVVAFVVK
jgi:hypothetical protein